MDLISKTNSGDAGAIAPGLQAAKWVDYDFFVR